MRSQNSLNRVRTSKSSETYSMRSISCELEENSTQLASDEHAVCTVNPPTFKATVLWGVVITVVAVLGCVGITITAIVTQYPGLIELQLGNDGGKVRIDNRPSSK